MFNKMIFKSAKSLKNSSVKNFATSNQGSMTARFHDIYIKELEKLQRTK